MFNDRHHSVRYRPYAPYSRKVTLLDRVWEWFVAFLQVIMLFAITGFTVACVAVLVYGLKDVIYYLTHIFGG